MELSRQEQSLMKPLTRVRTLFGFLRLHRHELFDEAFQEQLESKPWGQRARSPDLFSKRHFKIDLRAKTNTCPAGQVEVSEPGDTVELDPEACGACPLRAKCTQAASGRGRTASIAEDEALQSELRELQQTGAGRAVPRQRTAVEHALAHIAARKGHSARYIGTRRDLFAGRRARWVEALLITTI
ncbi:transposase [Sorangium sp. So ce341]|uniref:transposase n=1 Tax=Sorangium sp. So ce341 TaxID=3133302 RepID=UPI003F5F8783